MSKIKLLILPLFVLLLSGCAPGAADETQPTATSPPAQTTTTARAEETTETSDPETTDPAAETTEPTADETIPAEVPPLQLMDAFPNLTFEQPLDLLHAGDQSDRIFVVEQTGKIKVFANDFQIEDAAVFLDLTQRIDSSASEKGLLGMAFHPQYPDNGLFYVYYTNSTHSVITAYAVDPQNPDRALPDSEQIIIDFEQPYRNHNGGHLAFGPDGYLYIASGDGGGSGDPDNNSQNLRNLLGKILRIDIDSPEGGQPYAIPADNPFAGSQEGYREEIYAYGLRNPWRFSFDEERGWLWAADVGQNQVEEINLIESGLNYGWNIMEGSICYPESADCDQSGLTMPVWEYQHPLGRSITGGYAYYGPEHPYLNGAYIYGDFITGLIWALQLDDQLNPDNQLLLETNLNISSFGLDQEGELYIVDYRGKIYVLNE